MSRTAAVPKKLIESTTTTILELSSERHFYTSSFDPILYDPTNFLFVTPQARIFLSTKPCSQMYFLQQVKLIRIAPPMRFATHKSVPYRCSVALLSKPFQTEYLSLLSCSGHEA